MDKACPCGAAEPLAECCGRYLSGAELAPTAEALMRARYSAYCTEDAQYLFDTHHPDARSTNALRDIRQTIDHTEFLNLDIVSVQRGKARDHDGYVEFAAAWRARTGGAVLGAARKIEQMHENSFFIREDRRWFYVDGTQMDPYEPARNARCWCGSGKKFKQCHA